MKDQQVTITRKGVEAQISSPAESSGGVRNIQKMGISVPQALHVFTDEADHASANVFPLPISASVTVASAAGGGALPTRVFIFNQTTGAFLNNVTNNGSGAGSITYTFQDGFGGNVVSQLLAQARAGVGALCYGVSLRMTITASGAGDPAGLDLANPNFQVFDAFGNSIPNNFNITSDQTRSDFDTSIEVIPCIQNINAFTQFSFVMPVADTATVTFYFSPSFRR